MIEESEHEFYHDLFRDLALLRFWVSDVILLLHDLNFFVLVVLLELFPVSLEKVFEFF